MTRTRPRSLPRLCLVAASIAFFGVVACGAGSTDSPPGSPALGGSSGNAAPKPDPAPETPAQGPEAVPPAPTEMPPSEAPPAVGAPGALPCEVAAVVQSRCAHCHAATPLHGAPMPLVTAADFRAPGKLTPGSLVATTRDRVMAETMPPKSALPLTARERQTLLGWLDQGANDASAGATCAPLPPPPPHEQETLDCTPSHTFVSGGAEGYAVPLEQNHYQCFNLPVPFEPQEQAVAWAPVIGDPRVVHHWILYAVKGTSTDCGQFKRFIFGWAPGGGIGRMPPNIGNELPNPDERLLLEVHYYNPNRIAGIKDKTGVALCTTKSPRPIEAGVVTFGAVGIRIPPGEAEVSVSGTCGAGDTGQLTEPLHVLWSAPHMHKLGTGFKTTISNARGTTTLVDVKNWDFNDQVAYPADPAKYLISPGDAVTTTCTYRNPGSKEVRFGERTEDEMCFNFATVYPISAARFLEGRPARFCTDLLDLARSAR